LQAEGFDDDDTLDETIRKLENALKRTTKKEADGNDEIAVWCFLGFCVTIRRA